MDALRVSARLSPDNVRVGLRRGAQIHNTNEPLMVDFPLAAKDGKRWTFFPNLWPSVCPFERRVSSVQWSGSKLWARSHG